MSQLTDEIVERALSYGYFLAAKNAKGDEMELREAVDMTVAKTLANPPDIIRYPYTFLTNRIRWSLKTVYINRGKERKNPAQFLPPEDVNPSVLDYPSWPMERDELIERVKKKHSCIPEEFLIALIVDGCRIKEAGTRAGANIKKAYDWARKIGRLI